MSRPGTLLERIAWAADPPAHVAVGEAALRRSIVRNLGDVLNARVGHAPAQPDLGTPAPCELIHDYPACIPRMQAAMERCVARYEPRLTEVRVTYIEDPDPLRIHFQISARLASGSRSALAIRTHVDQTGRLQMG